MYQNRYSLLSIQLEYILSAGIQGCGGWSDLQSLIFILFNTKLPLNLVFWNCKRRLDRRLRAAELGGNQLSRLAMCEPRAQGRVDNMDTARDCKGISWRGATELISSHFQWMSVDGTSYQMIVSGCQWMAVDVSGCQWILASFIWDEVKVLLILLSIIYFRWMKMISFQYVCC